MEPSTSAMSRGSDSVKKAESIVYKSYGMVNPIDSESADELFSDLEETKADLTYYSPEVCKADQSSLNLSDLPGFLTGCQPTTPNTAVIPNTPLSLVPFLTKVNSQWTSDLETPQAQRTNHSHFDPVANSKESAEKTSVSKVPQTSMSQTKSDGEYISLSPVIKNRKPKRRPKRRIFKLNESPSSVSKIPKTEAVKDNSSTCESVPQTNLIQNHVSDSIQRKDVVNTESSLNTSTQNFFSNMSFSNIDKICTENFQVDNASGNTGLENNAMNKTLLGEPNIVHKARDLREDFSKFPQTNPSVAIGFQTASGKTVNVSKSALSKGQALFKEDLNDSFKTMDTKASSKSVDDNQDHCLFKFASGKPVKLRPEALKTAEAFFMDQSSQKENENENRLNIKQNSTPLNKIAPPKYKEKEESSEQVKKNVGFQTAGGRSISISQTALEQVRRILAEDTNKDERISTPAKVIKQSGSLVKQTDVKNTGFQTASGRSIIVTKAALQKASSLYSEDTEVTEDKENSRKDCLINMTENKASHSGFGFQTASGRQVSISETALQKVKSLFSENTDRCEKVGESKRDFLSNVIDNELPNFACGFQTAGGRNISVSETALQKGKSLFSEDTDRCEKVGESKRDSLSNVIDNELPNFACGFQTAGGRNISVSETALQKVKSLFSEDTDRCEKVGESKRDSLSNVIDNELPNFACGFQTAGGRNISVSETALQKVKSVFSEEPLEENPNNSILKRKISETEEDTPFKRKCNSSFKKLRVSNEFRARKLTYEDSAVDTKNAGTKLQAQDKTDQKATSNKLSCFDSISDEIFASTEALLADEGKSVPEPSTPGIATEAKENPTPSSPVIGRNFNARRKRSLNLKTRNLNRLIIDKKKPDIDKKQETELESKEPTIAEIQNKPQAGIDYGDTQLILNFIDNSAIVLQKRIEAAMKQDALIKQKAKNKPKPNPGRLLSFRKLNEKNRITWRQVTKKPPIPRSSKELVSMGIGPEILNITPATAVDHRFRCSDFYGHDLVQNNTDGVDVGENTTLILDENGYVGLQEIERAFLAIPSVDPSLIPNGWLENHYKWIIWKLASIDRRKFANINLPRALTPSEVIAQLKYRYDREIDGAQRPAIRKILEKDDVPSRRMVLCVSSIIQHSGAQDASTSPKPVALSIPKLILTDGWYGIPASVDQAMLRHISSGKIRVGTKLLVYGAELLNCEQGCFPLEAPGDVSLKIHTNSTRRARWDAKLGYVNPPRPIPTKLKDVCPNGGLVGKLMVVIARVYPMLYHEKTASGESIFRNARCEEKANLAYEEQCRLKIEEFYAKAEKQFCNPKKKPASSSSSDPDSMDLVANEWNGEYDKLVKEENLSSQERKQLLDQCRQKEEEFKEKLKSRLQASQPAPRQVRPLLKIRVVEGDVSAILSVWVPSEEVIDLMKEGRSMCICNTFSSGLRAGELQLSAGRNILFIPKSTCNIDYPRRICSPLLEMGKPSFNPAYNEFDTVGIVVYVGSGPYSMKHFAAVYLAHPCKDSFESSYLSILFWQGISTFGYAEILTPGSLVACSNLERRRTYSTFSNIPIAYCTERTVFTRNPRQKHFSQPLSELRAFKVDLPAYVRNCAEEVLEEARKKPAPKTPDCNLNRSICEKNVDGSRCVAEETSPFTSNYNARSSAIQMRLDKLQYYDEPPKLSPIVLKTSKRVLADFRSPVRTTSINGSKP